MASKGDIHLEEASGQEARPQPGTSVSATPSEAALAEAISHAVNYHSIDARLNMADFAIGELLAPEVAAWLRGETDVQVYERMTDEERAAIQ